MASGGSTRQEVGPRPVVLRAFGYVSAAGLALYAVLLSRQRQVDFEVYRMGGHHVLGSDLYVSHVTVAAGNLLFTYTPLAALLFWPFSLVSTGVGQVVWDITNVVALTALVAVSSAAARRRPLLRSDWYLALIALAPAGLLLWPVRYDLKLGQIDLVLVLMIVTDLTIGVSWRGKRLPPGALVGVAAAIKLTPLIFLPYLLVTRQWRAARNTACAFMVATGVMTALAPRSSWNYFTRYVYDVHRIGDSSITNNQTLRAALARAGLAALACCRGSAPRDRSLCWHGTRSAGVPPLVRSSRGLAVRGHRSLGLADFLAASLRVVCASGRLADLRCGPPPTGSGVGFDCGHDHDGDASGPLQRSLRDVVREGECVHARHGWIHGARGSDVVGEEPGLHHRGRGRALTAIPWARGGGCHAWNSAPANCMSGSTAFGSALLGRDRSAVLARAVGVPAYGAVARADRGRVDVPRLRRPRAEEPPRVTISHVRLLDG